MNPVEQDVATAASQATDTSSCYLRDLWVGFTFSFLVPCRDILPQQRGDSGIDRDRRLRQQKSEVTREVGGESNGVEKQGHDRAPDSSRLELGFTEGGWGLDGEKE